MSSTRTLLLICFLAMGQLVMAQKKSKPKAESEPNSGPAPASFELKDKQDTLGYALAITIMNDLKKQGFEYDMEAFLKGIQDANQGVSLLGAPSQTQQIIMKMQQEARKAKLQAGLDKANKFLQENKNKPGVVTLPSGLQYTVLREGTGTQPSSQSSVTTHYHGTLLDGTVFDSSVERGQPATFPVNGVIRAWQEMLVLMKEGGKVRLFCPPGLAYGEQGAPGGKIGPNEMLIFEIELIKVN